MQPSSSIKRWTLVATILASSMTFIDGTVVNVALPALQRSLNASITDVQWVIEAYALFVGALILVGGSLGDQLGRKRVFLGGVVAFTVASVICGLATSPGALITGRALQGIGAAFLIPGSLALISATFEGPEQGRAIGTWSGFSAITAAIGPVIGGWLVEHASWRAVFFINVPFAVVVVFLSVKWILESRDASRVGHIDWPGAALAVLGLSGIVFGLLEMPPLGAAHPLVVGAIAIGVASLAAMLVVERRRPNPMLPLGLFTSRTFTLTNILTLLLYAALSIMMFLIPINLIQVQGYSATAAGATLLPFSILMFVLSPWAGGLVARIGSRIPLTVGPAIAGVGFLLFVRPGVGGSFWTTFFPAMVVVGFGMTVTVAPLTTTVMGSISTEHAGVASGVNNAVSRIGGLLAIAAFGVLLSRSFESRLAPRLDRLALRAPARVAVNRELPKMAGARTDSIPELDPAAARQVRIAIDDSFVGAFRLVLIGAAVLAFVSALAGARIISRHVTSTREK